MRGMNPSTLQSMFQANHMSKAGLYDNQGGKMKKKPPMMLHSDPSILGMWPHQPLHDLLSLVLTLIICDQKRLLIDSHIKDLCVNINKQLPVKVKEAVMLHNGSKS